jgi:hypothetical protein
MSEAEPVNSELPRKIPPKRGRWQFSLASLLRMMTLMALLFALPRILEFLLEARVREQRLAERLRAAQCGVLRPSGYGYYLSYAPELIFDPWYPGIGSISLQHHPRDAYLKLPPSLKDAYRLQEICLSWEGTPAPSLEEFPSFVSLESVELHGDCFDEKQFSLLAKCRRLEHLSLEGKGVDDMVLEYVARLAQVRYLEISSERYTEQGVIRLTTLKCLRSLRFGRSFEFTGNTPPAINDRTLGDIAQIPSLEYLGLLHTNISGRGFSHLAKLKHLRLLEVCAPQLNEAGITALRSLDAKRTKRIIYVGPNSPFGLKERLRAMGCEAL